MTTHVDEYDPFQDEPNTQTLPAEKPERVILGTLLELSASDHQKNEERRKNREAEEKQQRHEQLMAWLHDRMERDLYGVDLSGAVEHECSIELEGIHFVKRHDAYDGYGGKDYLAFRLPCIAKASPECDGLSDAHRLYDLGSIQWQINRGGDYVVKCQECRAAELTAREAPANSFPSIEERLTDAIRELIEIEFEKRGIGI